jgi:hypothetical protein
LRHDVLTPLYTIETDPKRYTPTQKCFEDSVRRLAAWTYFLPASEHHHHTTPYGLFKHSLEVAQHLVSGYISSGRGSVDPDERGRDRLMLFIIGITHDLGKIYGVVVTYGPDRDGKMVTWRPNRKDTLAAFCADARKLELPIQAEWKDGRGLRGLNSHEALGPYLLALVVDRGVIPWLDYWRIGIINLALLGSCTSEYGAIPDDLRKADVRSVIGELQDLEANRIVAYGTGDPNYWGINHSEDFVTAFRRIYNKGLFDINVPNGAVLISRTHTVLRLPLLPNFSTAFSEAARAIREFFRSKGRSKSQEALPYEQEDAPNIFESSIAFERCRAPSRREHWCPVDQPLSARGSPVIAHHVYTTDGLAVHSWRCIVIRNDILWGPIDFSKNPGFYRHPVWFTSHIDLVTATVVPATVGFMDLPAHLRPVPVSKTSSGAAAPAPVAAPRSAKGGGGDPELELKQYMAGLDVATTSALNEMLADESHAGVDELIRDIVRIFPHGLSSNLQLIVELLGKGPLPMRLRRPALRLAASHLKTKSSETSLPPAFAGTPQPAPTT